MMGDARIVAACPSFLRYVNRLVYQRLMESGMDVVLVAPQTMLVGTTSVEADPRRDGEPEVLRFPLWGRNPRFQLFRGLFGYLLRHKPDIVILESDPASLLAVSVGLFQKLRGGHLVCISCDNVRRKLSQAVRNGSSAVVKHLVFGAMLLLGKRVVDRVLCINKEIEDIQKTRGFQTRTARMPLGFDSSICCENAVWRRETRQALGIEEHQFVIGYFGRISREKGLHVLFNALSQITDLPWILLVDRFDDYATPYDSEIHSLVRELDLTNRMVFFESIHESMGRYMNAADLAVVPSITMNGRQEQYGRVAPEAMACGVPVIASDCGALPELLGDAGIIVKEGDCDALAKSIRRVIVDDNWRHHVAVRCRQHANFHLSVSAQVAVLRAVIESLLDVSSASSVVAPPARNGCNVR